MSMTTTEFLTLLMSLLERVLAGSINHTELQSFVDDAVIEDKLPENLSKEVLNNVFSLQTDLELIAEHQSTYAGSSLVYSQSEIVEKLRNYENCFHL